MGGKSKEQKDAIAAGAAKGAAIGGHFGPIGAAIGAAIGADKAKKNEQKDYDQGGHERHPDTKAAKLARAADIAAEM